MVEQEVMSKHYTFMSHYVKLTRIDDLRYELAVDGIVCNYLVSPEPPSAEWVLEALERRQILIDTE